MKRLKGPDLKMPDVKAPAFLADVYYDLRDRRLLPLIALVVVATAAVPFLLGDSEEAPPPPATAGVDALREAEAAGASLTVVEAKPGLRDYRKRLRRRTPSDPFEQKYTGVPRKSQLKSVETGATSGGGGGGGSPAATVTSGGGGDPEGAAPGGGKGGEPGKGSPGKAPSGGKGKARPPRLIEFVLDVWISRSHKTADGGREMGKPKLRRRVRPLTPLPGKKAPVVTTMGVNLRNGKVMFLVGDDVKSVSGEFACVARTDTCELLEVEPGFPLDFLRGPNRVRYRIKVTKIDAIWAGRVGDGRSSRAALQGPYRAALEAP